MEFFRIKMFLPLLGMLLAITAGCSSDKNSAQPQGGAMQMPPALVEVLKVEPKNTAYIENYIAQTEGSKAVDVRAQVAGIIKEKKYTEGQFVQQGTVLFVIEPDSYMAALTQAQGSLAQAQAGIKQARQNFDRAKNLFNQNAMSKKDYDAAQAAYDTSIGQVDAAQAAVEEAKIRLGYTNVIAPVAGYTSKANYSVGNLLSSTATMPLTTINQVDPIYVNFSVPANSMNLMRNLANQKKLTSEELTVELTLEDGSIYPYIGKVTFFDKLISTSTGDIKVRAEFTNPNLVLLPGQFVNAKLLGFTLVNAIIIPQKAIMKIAGRSSVIVVDANNVAHYTPVTPALSIGNNVLIGDGLKGGETIIIEGLNKVAEGGQVKIVPTNSPATAK